MFKYNKEQIINKDDKTFIFVQQSFNERLYREIEFIDDTYYRFVSDRFYFLV